MSLPSSPRCPVAQRAGRAGPWDALLHTGPIRLSDSEPDPAQARPGTKLARLLSELAGVTDATTLTLSVATELDARQVWGLLKTPRAIGQVRFESGRWSLVRDFRGRDVERAAALLRERGWRLQPPKDHT